tara:strand:+ start:516 stop:845 length:330 start_codon:yes stop_codon:yes gene_type:complete
MLLLCVFKKKQKNVKVSVLEIFLACINQSIHQRAEKDLRRRICETQRRSTERNFLNEEHITPIHHHVFTYSITSLNFLRVMEKKRRRLKMTKDGGFFSKKILDCLQKQF